MIYQYKDYEFIGGTDEVGRGCLAGPVVAAAVILPRNIRIRGLNDSKQLTHLKRKELEVKIKEKALSYSITFINNQRIDEINILRASHEAMGISVSKLKPQPEVLLVDGNSYLQESTVPFDCIVNGDSKYASIAAASILAKISRDEYMISIANRHPNYDWESNKGYPTPKHIEGIKKYGFTPLHRKSFHLKSLQYRLDI